MTQVTKWCPWHDNKQGDNMPIDQFGPNIKAKDGKQSACRECMRVNRRARYARDGNSLRNRYAGTRATALNRGIDWQLTYELWEDLVTRPCVYGTSANPAIRSGIDRIDNDKGYTEANSQPCCAYHNTMKSDIFTHQEMKTLLAVLPRLRECRNATGSRKRLSINPESLSGLG